MNLQLPCTVNVIGYAKTMHALICMEAGGYCMAGISLFLHRGGLLSHPHPPIYNATETLLHSSLHCPEPVWLCYGYNHCSCCAVILCSSSFEFALCCCGCYYYSGCAVTLCSSSASFFAMVATTGAAVQSRSALLLSSLLWLHSPFALLLLSRWCRQQGQAQPGQESAVTLCSSPFSCCGCSHSLLFFFF